MCVIDLQWQLLPYYTIYCNYNVMNIKSFWLHIIKTVMTAAMNFIYSLGYQSQKSTFIVSFLFYYKVIFFWGGGIWLCPNFVSTLLKWVTAGSCYCSYFFQPLTPSKFRVVSVNGWGFFFWVSFKDESWSMWGLARAERWEWNFLNSAVIEVLN